MFNIKISKMFGLELSKCEKKTSIGLSNRKSIKTMIAAKCEYF